MMKQTHADTLAHTGLFALVRLSVSSSHVTGHGYNRRRVNYTVCLRVADVLVLRMFASREKRFLHGLASSGLFGIVLHFRATFTE